MKNKGRDLSLIFYVRIYRKGCCPETRIAGAGFLCLSAGYLSFDLLTQKTVHGVSPCMSSGMLAQR